MRITKLASGRYQVRWRDRSGVQRARNHRTKELAQKHCRELDKGLGERPKGQTIKELLPEYRASPTWMNLDYPTQIIYGRTIDRWFDLVEETQISELDPARISKWLADLKVNVDRFGKRKQRQSFLKELNVLKALLAWYRGYKDDPDFVSPIRKRHEEEAWLDGKSYSASDEDFADQVSDEIPLTEEEFHRFRAELLGRKFGDQIAIMADVQFDHSLRVCEVAAVMWPDVKWSSSEIKFQRHIQYVHQARGTFPDKVVPGLKNRKNVKRRGQRFARRQCLSKINPFFPRSTKGLRELYLRAADKTGFVFVNPETQAFFTYKAIKNQYDRAFKRAGLPYTGTHIVRYGGVNHFMGHYDTDEATGMELLGNSSEGRYILRRSTKVAKALQSKEPSASEVHSALMTPRNDQESRNLEKSGGTDGMTLASRMIPTKTAL